MKIKAVTAALAGAVALGISLLTGGAASAHPSPHPIHPTVSVTDRGFYVTTPSPVKTGEALSLIPAFGGAGTYTVVSVVPWGNVNKVVLSPSLPGIYLDRNASFRVSSLP